MFADQALERFLKLSDVHSVIDIGSGEGQQANSLRAAGKIVTTVALHHGADVVDDYMRTNLGPVDGIWASHVLEHMPDTHLFLCKCFADLRDDGVLAITVPPAKHNIVGGHVSLWNEGLLLYRLILAGFDCSNAQVGVYGYNISVIVRKRRADLPELAMDCGDIERLEKFFPMPVKQDFNGQCGNIGWESPEKKPTKIAIVGGAPSSAHLAPYDDPNFEIWVHGNQIDRHEGKRITRIFEIHDDLTEHPPEYAQILVDKGIPMVVGEGFPIKASHVEVYPFEAVNRFMGEHLTSTPAHMMGYAMLQSVKEIMIYGCDMAVDNHEYFYQRPVMYAWIGFAIGRGIKIGIPKASSLFKDPYVEGRKSGGKPKLGLGPFTESEFHKLRAQHVDKMREIEQEQERLQAEYATHSGCMQAYEKMGTAARAIESGQHIETLSQTTVVI